MQISTLPEAESDQAEIIERIGFVETPPARSIVLLVEDNPINLKVCLLPILYTQNV